MRYRGAVLSVEDLLSRALSADGMSLPELAATIRHTAATNAHEVAMLLSSGTGEAEGWRFGILQTLDDYRSARRRGGLPLAVRIFTDEPEATGSANLDAAFAALADFLATRDGWSTPQWAQDVTRRAVDWFPNVPDIFRADAQRESPPAFRQRGIFITDMSLARA